MLTLSAPAKVNLTLEVLGKRTDDFHEIRSVAQTIGLCDILRFQESAELEFRCAFPGWTAGESLISRAAALLKEATGCSRGALITVEKSIPLFSGLGGDSSNAATTLRGLNRLWRLGLSPDELMGLAGQLGSDESLFLYGGTVLLEGRGETVTPLPPIPDMWVVLLVPPIPVTKGKTGRLYSGINAEHYTEGQHTERLVSRLKRGEEVDPSLIFNVFDKVTLDYFDRLGDYRERFLKSGAGAVHVAGSGPVLFTMTADIASAEGIYQSLKAQNLEAFLSNTLVAVDYHG